VFFSVKSLGAGEGGRAPYPKLYPPPDLIEAPDGARRLCSEVPRLRESVSKRERGGLHRDGR
jgi:hypothetical protein